jgi:hypothetical protein
MYLRHVAKFRSKLVACYMCRKACQKSCITTKCHALWAKMSHKNDDIFYLCLTDVVYIVIVGYDKLFLCLTSQ